MEGNGRECADQSRTLGRLTPQWHGGETGAQVRLMVVMKKKIMVVRFIKIVMVLSTSHPLSPLIPRTLLWKEMAIFIILQIMKLRKREV